MDPITELLTRGVDAIYPSRESLEKALRSGKKLRLYQGFDPTGIQLHIGHLTGLMKLRQFQNLGHNVIFLIGDGTGQAGDPSGKLRTREKFLSLDELKHNARDYVMQASKIVRFEGENKAEILYNSDWLNKLTLVDILSIAGHFTLQQLEERDMYQQRKKKGDDINFREFLYPLLQGYDSVAMNINLELGGVDQTFNMLAGRKLVREMQGKEKYVMTTPLLSDSSGKKIGKTEGNVIALNADPIDFYGMIMNLPDEVIASCFEVITDFSIEEVGNIKKALANGENPMKFKKKLAFSLTQLLNSQENAKSAQEFFETTFQKREQPKDLPSFTVSKTFEDKPTIINLVRQSGFVISMSEARRLIRQGAVEYDGQKLTDPNATVKIKTGSVLRVGKHRFIKTVK